MRKIHITRFATAAGITSAIAIASVAFAADQKPATNKVTVKFVTAPPALMAKYGTDSTPSQTGMRAYVDADTKQLRAATQAELNESAAASAAPAAAKRSASVAKVSSGPIAEKLANGATRVALDESYLSYAVANIGPDGKVKQECVDQQPNAETALRVAASKKGANRNEK